MCFAVWKTTNLLTCESDWTSGSSSSHLFLNQYKPTESENSQWTFTWLWHTVEVCCHLLVMQVYYRRAADLYDNKKLITYGITYGVSPFKKYTCHFKWNALKLQCNYTLSQKLFFSFFKYKMSMNHAQSGVQCKILPHGEVAIDLKAIRTTVKQRLLVENEPKTW